MVKYHITAVVGNRGTGKTCFMTRQAVMYEREGVNVFSNFTLFDIVYFEINFNEIAGLPEYLRNGVILMDEGQVGTDSYNFLNKSVKRITDFVTQIRKRKVRMYVSTQRFKMLAKRMREQTNYIIMTNNTVLETEFILETYDRSLPFDEQKIKTLKFNGEPYFKNYDTDEVIDNTDRKMKKVLNVDGKRYAAYPDTEQMPTWIIEMFASSDTELEHELLASRRLPNEPSNALLREFARVQSIDGDIKDYYEKEEAQ